MEILGVAGVASITVICFLVGEIVSVSTIDSKFIPAICGVVGAALGVAALYFMPGFPANNVIDAVAIGIVSGLAATGIDQLGKQLRQ